MHKVRSVVLANQPIRPESPLQEKRYRAADEGPSLTSLKIKREETRRANQRGEDRIRLTHTQTITLVFRRRKREASLVNVSGWGAMIETDFTPDIGEKIELVLADNRRIRGFARWVRGKRMGFEVTDPAGAQGGPRWQEDFVAHVLCSEADVIRQAALKPPPTARTPRRRMIWNATLHSWEQSLPVRVRNISTEGALIACEVQFEIGTQVMLDLGESGSAQGEVRWLKDGYTGLQFNERFDLDRLAMFRQNNECELGEWPKPDYLEDLGSASPGAGRPRLSIEELAATLSGHWGQEENSES